MLNTKKVRDSLNVLFDFFQKSFGRRRSVRGDVEDCLGKILFCQPQKANFIFRSTHGCASEDLSLLSKGNALCHRLHVVPARPTICQTIQA